MDPSTVTVAQILSYLSNITIGSLVAIWAYLGWRGEWVWKRERDSLIDRYKAEVEDAKRDCAEWKQIGTRMIEHADEAIRETRLAINAAAATMKKK